jgi:predicted amidohydrolase
VKCVALQFQPAWEDPAQSRDRIAALLDKAGPLHGALVVLPEMAESGFTNHPERVTDGKSEMFAAALARTHGCFLQHGFTAACEGAHWNMVAVASPRGEIIGRYAKAHLFSLTGEPAHYRAGGGASIARLVDADAATPRGPAAAASLAPMICYDLRFPELWRVAALAGAEVFALSACWPAIRGEHWNILAKARAVENQACVIACNRVGEEPGATYAGGSLIIGPAGETLAQAASGTELLSADLDIDALRAWRGKFPSLRDIRRDLLGRGEVHDR